MQARIKIINKLTKQVQIMSDKSDEEWAVQNGYSKELHEVEEAFDGKWYLQGYAPEQSMKSRLAALRDLKKREAQAALTQAIAEITPYYPTDEKVSFAKQEEEALKYRANPEISESEIPCIAGIAKGRNMELSVLADKILAKAASFAMVSGIYMGRKQRIEDLADRAETEEQMAAIDVAAIFAEPLE